MKFRLFLFPALFFFGAACNSSRLPDGTVVLFNDYKMKLQPGEEVKELDAVQKKVYEQYCNNTAAVQVPFFKMLSHKDYTLFIGLPFHSSLERLAAAKETAAADTVFAHLLSDTSFYRQAKQDSFYVTEYVYRPDSSMMICIFALSKSPSGPVSAEAMLRQRIFK